MYLNIDKPPCLYQAGAKLKDFCRKPSRPPLGKSWMHAEKYGGQIKITCRVSSYNYSHFPGKDPLKDKNSSIVEILKQILSSDPEFETCILFRNWCANCTVRYS